MAFDACGIGQAVVEIIQTDDVDDIENVAIAEAMGAQPSDIVFTDVRRGDGQFHRVIERRPLAGR